MRLFVGYFFFETGWAKPHNLDTFTQRFAEWGIPYPAFNAALSAWTECLGGALTIAGLATRFVSVAMVINMIVAIVSVKLKNVSGLDDLSNWMSRCTRCHSYGWDLPGPAQSAWIDLIRLAFGLHRDSRSAKAGSAMAGPRLVPSESRG